MSVIERPAGAPREQDDLLGNLPGPAGAIYRWLDDRLGIDAVIRPILVHPVPRSTNWFNVLGSATLTAFIFQLVTGVFLALYYVPAPNDAYRSLQYIVNNAEFGHFVRGIHYWGASAMILLIFAHTARVFLTGSYKYPRELNWILGVGLLFSTILMGFTGQLLVWNQDSYWAIVVGAEQAARTPFIGHWVADLFLWGKLVGATTLTHFFVIHVFLVPGLMLGLIGGHLYLVVYQGISEWPEPSSIVDPRTYKAKYHKILEDGIPFFPDAMAKDAIFAFFAGVVVIALALKFGGAPLGHQADPSNPVTLPRPFWFLIWYFALLAEIPPTSEDFVIILFPAVIMTWMMLLPLYANKGQRAPSKRPWAVGSVFIAVLAFVVLAYEGYQSPWSPAFNTANGQLPRLKSSLVSNLATPAAKRGAYLFRNAGCIACHMIDGDGGQRGPALDNVIQDFSANHASAADRARIVQQISVGGEGMGYQGMPAYGSILNQQQMQDLVAFFSKIPAAKAKAAKASTGGVAAPSKHPHRAAASSR
jgi:ubiquinol-cytochrome c reductase cytochrome b subunit